MQIIPNFPLGGRKNKGGQRCGEMETACLIGHDAPCNLHEFLTTKSDCIDLKNSSFPSLTLILNKKVATDIQEHFFILKQFHIQLQH